jgi:hypothetical protein
LVTSWDSELIYNTNRGDVRRAVGKRIAMMPIVVCHNTHLRHLLSESLHQVEDHEGSEN